MKTVVMNTKAICHEWYLVDATDKVIGRLATEIAALLIGKKKPGYSPNQDHGDCVVVINSDKVRISGNKADTKVYFRHSGYPGGAKYRTFKEQMVKDSTKTIIHAVKGMVPKTTLGRAILKKLHVYGGATHPHAAQSPKPITIK